MQGYKKIDKPFNGAIVRVVVPGSGTMSGSPAIMDGYIMGDEDSDVSVKVFDVISAVDGDQFDVGDTIKIDVDWLYIYDISG